MAFQTLTSKWQTTIPKAVRRQLGSKPGDKIRFLVEDDGRVVVVPATLHLRDLRVSLPKPSKPVSVEQMKEAILERAGRR